MSRAFDVVVVGGGVIGCAVTYELARRSVRVLLLDKSLPGRATSASAGGLWPVGEAVGLGCGVIHHAAQTGSTDSPLPEDSGGPEPLPAVFRDFLFQSNAEFPRLHEELKELSGVDVEYDPSRRLLFAMFNERERAFVDRVAGSLPRDAQPERLSVEEAVKLEPQLTREVIGGALLSGEHQVNPMALAEAYKRGAVRLGGTCRHDARVAAFRAVGNRIVGIELADEFIPCQTVVNAAGAWAGKLAATIGVDLPVFPVRGQIVLTETLPHTLSACLSTSACYMAQKKHGEVLIGSTTERAGFDVSVTEVAVRSLCQGAAHAISMLRGVRVKRIWAGLRPGTPDELPILGAVRGLDGYVNATGGFRTGIVASPLTGQVIAQHVCREPLSHRIEPFSCGRAELALSSERLEVAGVPSRNRTMRRRCLIFSTTQARRA